MKRTGVITLSLMSLAIVAGIFYIVSIDESEIQKRNNTQAAQALLVEEENSFTDLAGNTLPLSEKFGNVLVATSWASWCPQCAQGLIELGQLADRYDTNDITFLAVNRAEDTFAAERYLNTVEISNSITIVLDPTDHYFGASEGYAMPETIVYDQDGQVVLHQRGNINVAELQITIDSLMQ